MGQQHRDELTAVARQAPGVDGLEADVRHLHGRVIAIQRELAAYESALRLRRAGELTEPVLIALRAALVPRNAMVGTLGHLESVLANLLWTLASGDTRDA